MPRTLTLTDSGSLVWDDGTNAFTFVTPTALGGAVSLELPSVDGGVGDVLSTNGAGVLSFVAAGSGTISGGGTLGFVPRFTGAAAIGDGVIRDDGASRIAVGKAIDPLWSTDINGTLRAAATTAGAETLRISQASNTGLTAVFEKTGTTSGTAVQMDNAGTGVGLDINQTGEAVAMTVDKTSGGATDAVQMATDGTADTLSLSCSGAGGRSLMINHTASSIAAEIQQNTANDALIIGSFGAGDGIDINSPAAATGSSVNIDHSGEGNGLDLNFTSTTAGTFFGIDIDASGAGVTARTMNATQNVDADMVTLSKTGVAGGEVLSITNAGTGSGIMITQNGNGSGLDIDKTGAGSGTACAIENDGTGIGLLVDQDGDAICARFDGLGTLTDAVVEILHNGANTRGALFLQGVSGDPASPLAGDIWYENGSTNQALKYEKTDSVLGAITVPVSPFATTLANFFSFSKGGAGTQSVTIATGAITINSSNVTVDTEASAATDDLDNINSTTSLEDGQTVVLRAADSARTVVVRDTSVSGGNIRVSGASQTLDHIGDTIELMFSSADGNWLMIASSSNA